MSDDKSTRKEMIFPPGWTRVIDGARRKRPFAQFILDAVEEKIGKGKLPPRRGRGQPRKIAIDERK